MNRNNSRSYAAIHEKFRISLDKAETNPGIAKALKKIGYGHEIINEGKVLLESSRKIFDANLIKKDELSAVRAEFSKHRKQMDSTFREHRQKALILFKTDRVKAEKLALSGKYPSSYDLWLETARKFYEEIVSDPEIQQRFQRLNLTKEEAEAGLAGIMKQEALYAEQLKANGVSKHFTREKNKVFAEISEWMSDFYGAARLVMRKEPELLEALHKSV